MTETQQLLAHQIQASRNKRNRILFVILNRYSLEQVQHDIEDMNIPKLNVNLLVSEKLRQFPPDRRPIEIGKILRSLVLQGSDDVIFLNHIEYLFDRELKQNPIKLFENLSGNKTIIILWPGSFESGCLTYATPEHHEYYQSDDSYASYVVEL